MMEWFKFIFLEPFFTTGDFEFNLLKLLLLIAVVVLTTKTLSFYRQFIDRQFHKNERPEDERARFLRQYGTYLIVTLSALVVFAGLGLWNLIEAFMGFTFYESRETKFKFSVGNIFIILLIFLIAGFISRMTRIVIRKNFSSRAWIDQGKEFTIRKLLTYFIYLVAFLVAIESIGADLSSLLIASAALLVGVGIGLQHIFSDLVSGFILLFEGTFKVGDIIEYNTLVARVDRIDIRTSKVVTRDGKYIIIPNSLLTKDNIINWSHSTDITRFQIKVRVAYGSDTQKVRQILHQVAESHPEVSNKRPIIVRFADFADFGLQFELFFWAAQTWTIETIMSDIRFEIDRVFREEGIQTPINQHDIYLHQPTKGYGNPPATTD